MYNIYRIYRQLDHKSKILSNPVGPRARPMQGRHFAGSNPLFQIESRDCRSVDQTGSDKTKNDIITYQTFPLQTDTVYTGP